MITKEQVKKKYLELKTFAENFFNANKVQKFLDAQLEDGTKVQIEGDAPAIGGAIMVVAEDGTTAPLPDGEYMIGDTKCVVANGLITEVEAKEAAAATPPTEPAPAETKMEGQNYDEALAKMEARIVAMEDMLKSAQTMATESSAKVDEGRKLIMELQNENKELKKLAEQSFQLVELLSNEPSATPTQKPVKTETETLTAMQKFRKENGL